MPSSSPCSSSCPPSSWSATYAPNAQIPKPNEHFQLTGRREVNQRCGDGRHADDVPKADNVVLLGPPGIGKTILAIGLGIKAAQAGHSVLFDTATNWISRLGRAHHAGALELELKKIRRPSHLGARTASRRV